MLWTSSVKCGLPRRGRRTGRLAGFPVWRRLPTKALGKLPPPGTPFALVFHQVQIADEDLKDLARFENLQAVSVTSYSLTKPGLKSLAAVKNLRLLSLYDPPVTKEVLQELTALKHLHTLSIYSVEGDDALKGLAGLTRLRSLVIHETRVTDKGLKALAGLTDFAPWSSAASR